MVERKRDVVALAVLVFVVGLVLVLGLTGCASSDDWGEYKESLKYTTCTNESTGDVIEKDGCKSCPKGYIKWQSGACD